MNYLAHAYLSFGHQDILVGNMISDFIKGRKKFDYPALIQDGITLHRIIDTYTDEHPAVKEAKQYFRPHYRLYSGAFVDVVFDHFLATDESEFTEQSLHEFSSWVFSTIEQSKDWFPPGFAQMFPYMVTQNWLFGARTTEGTERSMRGVVRRAKYLAESSAAAYIFESNYQPLRHCYRQFWAEAKPFIQNQFNLLLDLRKDKGFSPEQ